MWMHPKKTLGQAGYYAVKPKEGMAPGKTRPVD
jgi:hypothetical protein